MNPHASRPALILGFLLLVAAPTPAQFLHGQVERHAKVNSSEGGFPDLVDAGDRLGEALAVLDLDGDGVDDLAVGAPGTPREAGGSGVVWLVLLDDLGRVRQQVRLEPPGGVAAVDFGRALTSPGDIDGNGTPDLAVSGGRFAGDPRGAIWVLGLTPLGGLAFHQELAPPEGDPLDGWGRALAGVGDLDGDGVPDLAVGAPTGDGGPGALWLVTLASDGGALARERFGASSVPGLSGLESGDRFGAAVTLVGDVDGDGRDDLAVGAPGDADVSGVTGAVWTVFLGPGGGVTGAREISAGTGGLTSGLAATFRELGAALAPTGDVDGDGVPDLAAGAPGSDSGTGLVFVLNLAADGTCAGHFVLGQDDELLADLAPGGRFGAALARNGGARLEVGAPLAPWEASGPSYGRTYRLALAPSGGLGDVAVLDAGDLGATLEASSDFGASLALLGDLDDDGIVELAAVDQGGQVWILSVDAAGGVTAFHRIAEASPLGQLLPHPTLIQVVAGPGDLDGDGIEDLVLGLPLDAGLFGASTGKVFLANLDSQGGVRSVVTVGPGQGGFGAGLDVGDRFGASVTALGDLDGDGSCDLAVGAPLDDDGGPQQGAVWILFLGSDGMVKGTTKISATTGGLPAGLEDGAHFGSALAPLGDVDGDGVMDLAVGAEGSDLGGTDRGAVWVLLLRPDGVVREALRLGEASGGLTPSLPDGSGLGRSLASLGDVDGDGVVDLAAGTALGPEGSGSGGLCVLFLERGGRVKWHQLVGPGQGGFTGVLSDQEDFGRAVALLGDLDGDGAVDLAVGSADGSEGQGDQQARGAVWILFGRRSRWTPMGGAVGSVLGTPSLSPAGTLEAGAATTLALTQASRYAPVWILMGAAAAPTPFKGGTLIPVPQVIVSGIDTGPLGTLSFDFSWPPGLGPGTELHAQVWIEDPALGPQGYLATQGVRARVP